MKIALYQYQPAIRLYKTAILLQSLGHKVTIFKKRKRHPVQGLDWSEFKIKNIEDVVKLSKRYKVLICYNPGLEVPANESKVIQYVGDLKGIHYKLEREEENLKKAEVVIFVSENQLNHAKKMYGIEKGYVVYNALLKCMAGEHKERQPGTAVYSGTLSNVYGSSRNVYTQLRKAAKRYDLHIYPTFRGLPEGYEQLRATIHKPVSPYKLVSELSKYEYGLILISDPTITRMAVPNKYFEYMAAGCKIISDYNINLPFMHYEDQAYIFEKILKEEI